MFELGEEARYSLMAAASALAEWKSGERDSPFSYWFSFQTAAARVLWLSPGNCLLGAHDLTLLGGHNGHFFPLFLLQCSGSGSSTSPHFTAVLDYYNVILLLAIECKSLSLSPSVQAFGRKAVCVCVWPVDDELRLVLFLFLSVIPSPVLLSKWIINGAGRWTLAGHCPLCTLSSLPTSQLKTERHESQGEESFIAYNFISRRTGPGLSG